MGVAYLINVDEIKHTECAIVIADKWQGRGLGTKLLSAVLEIGRTEA
jgi:GNAT superfamily N-acetyltransferase